MRGSGHAHYPVDVGPSIPPRSGVLPVYPRNDPPGVAVDEPAPIDAGYIRNMVSDILRALGDLANLIVNKSNRVDEYNTETLGTTTNTTILVQPEWEVPEIIESIVVVGPVTTQPTFTLRIGKRTWPLQLPASGILVIAPVKLNLGRSDDRQILNTSVAGDWSLELMGYALTGKRGGR